MTRPPVTSETKRRSSPVMIVIGSRMKARSPAPITGSSAPKLEPSTMRRPMPLCATSVGALQFGVCGANGQNARRPKIVSSAGSSVSMEMAAQPTPIAPIGPSPEVPLTFAMLRQSSAAMTVAADANTAGPADVIAACMAACRSSVWCSSSRYLATIKRA